MLESKELTKVFGSKTAVDHISMKLEAGHVYAMMGPNGSGKTTWMKMAAGLVKPTSGQVFFNGEPVGVKSREKIAFLSTEPYFYAWMTAADVGKYYRDFFEDFSMEEYRRLLEFMELDGKLKTKGLSSGMMAKLKVAVTMARDAAVYMLDEPFNGIDLLARDEMRKCVLEKAGPDKLVLISSHLVEEMDAIADRAVFIRQGVLVENIDLGELKASRGIGMADRYREVYGHGEGV